MRKAVLLFLFFFVMVANGVVVALDQNNVFSTVGRIFAIPTLALWLVYMIAQRRLRRLSRFHYWALAFMGWNAFSAFWSVSPDDTYTNLYRYFPIFLVSIVMWDLCRKFVTARLVFQAFLLGPYLAFILTVKNYLAGNEHGMDRYSTAGIDVNEQAFYTALGIGIAWYLGTSKDDSPWYFRLLNLAYPFVAFGGILLTASRGGLVDAIPGYLYILFTIRRAKRGYLVAVVGLALVGGLFLTKGDFSKQYDRLLTTATSASTDQFSGRTEAWLVGLDIFARHPLLGVGAGSYQTISISDPRGAYRPGEGLAAHNTYLSVLCETGPVGLILLLGMYASIVSTVWKRGGPMRACLLTALASFFIGTFSITTEPKQTFWLFLTIIVCFVGAIGSQAFAPGNDVIAESDEHARALGPPLPVAN